MLLFRRSGMILSLLANTQIIRGRKLHYSLVKFMKYFLGLMLTNLSGLEGSSIFWMKDPE
jgi:hypothetical protein